MNKSYKQFCKTYPQNINILTFSKGLLINDIIKLFTYPHIQY